MIIDCDKRWRESFEWHQSFAYWPVKVGPVCVWWQRYERRRLPMDGCYINGPFWFWEKRLIQPETT